MPEIVYIKLSELTKKVEAVIKQSFGTEYYWIIAEISSHSFYTNPNRHYFELIEKAENKINPIAKVKGVSWEGGSQYIKFFEKETGQKFTNGLEVLIKVKVEFTSAYGFQLVLLEIDQAFTLGNLEKQRIATLIKLVSENPSFIKKVGEEYFTVNKQLKFNTAIKRIALIGSPNSQGFTDFEHTIKVNQFGYKFSIDIYQSSVQGSEAEQELINKLIAIYKSNKKYDCVVIIRGGGGKTDFLVFDSYNLARAVAKFPIPIITGIGHHKDVSIVDLMAHTSTKTPTKVAEFIISHNRTFEDAILLLQKSLIIKSQQLLSNSLQKINATNIIIINKSRTFLNFHKDSLYKLNQIVINNTKTILYNRQTNLVSLLNQILSKPKIITANKFSELNNLLGNLKIFSNKYLINQKGYLGHYESIVKLMSPKNILKKGFAIVSQKGRILKNAETIIPGNDLVISMELYEINTKVISKSKNNGTESEL